MGSNFTHSQEGWLWLSAGAVAFVVGGVLSSKMYNKRMSNNRITISSIVEDNKEDPCDEDGATILKRLGGAYWNKVAIEFLNMLDFEQVSDHQLRAFAGEQLSTLRNNIISLEIIIRKFRDAKEVVRFVSKILEMDRTALALLKPFGRDLLKTDLEKHTVCAKAQSYAHTLSFLSNNGRCAEVVGALTINLPVRRLVCKTLKDDLVKYRSWSMEQVAFLDLLGRPIVDFHELSLCALNKALQMERTSWRQIECSAKVLQESEKLFWEYIIWELCEIELPHKEQSVTYWERIPLPTAPTLSGVLSDFDIPKNRTKWMSVKSSTLKRSKTDSTCKHSISGSNASKYIMQFPNMSKAQLDLEIKEMSRHIEKMATNFNALQDLREEMIRTHSMSSCSVHPSRTESIEFSDKGPTELRGVKEESNKEDEDENKDSESCISSEANRRYGEVY